MVLLHLLRTHGIHVPLIFFREPWQPRKYEFQERIIRDWNLLVYSWHPRTSAMQQAGDEYEVQNWYEINGTSITCPTGMTEPAEDLPWTCALDILRRPKQKSLITETYLDGLWIGHKKCDSDPILGGDAGTRIEARVLPTGASLIFPLRDWTHQDIWNYIEKYNVPYDEERYEKVNGEWRERPEKRHNLDYVHACAKCLDKRDDAPKFVHCPKLKTEIENISDQVPWADQKKLSYMEN